MEAGFIRTTRENYTIPERFPFGNLMSGELWYQLTTAPDGKLLMMNPQGGPLMVLHYRCIDCGYLESYAHGTYPPAA